MSSHSPSPRRLRAVIRVAVVLEEDVAGAPVVAVEVEALRASLPWRADLADVAIDLEPLGQANTVKTIAGEPIEAHVYGERVSAALKALRSR